jgi:hypothetical protein
MSLGRETQFSKALKQAVAADPLGPSLLIRNEAPADGHRGRRVVCRGISGARRFASFAFPCPVCGAGFVSTFGEASGHRASRLCQNLQ